ncbi:MAG: hypothetical protein AB7S48_04775 [Bacteroidales bacterium]
MKFPIRIIGIKVIDITINVLLFFVGLFAIGFTVGVGLGLLEKLF